jgi:uncharacterized protein with NRDE domain
MNLLILNGPCCRGANPQYRGTYRARPTYCDDASSQDEINLLFSWYLMEGGESGVVHDLAKAGRFAELSNIRLDRENFEVIEVTHAGVSAQSGGISLGFDLSAGFNNSLLWWGLKYDGSIDTLREVDESWKSASRYYSKKLNRYGLFSSEDLAIDCRNAMISLQSLSPNFFEGGDLSEFCVTQVIKPSMKTGL